MGATRRTSWMLGSTSDPARLNMLANTRVLSSQPSQNVAIDWSNPLTRGLLGVYLPHTLANLVNMQTMIGTPGDPLRREPGRAGLELRSGAMEMWPPIVDPTDPKAKFDGVVGTALALCRQGTPTSEGFTFYRDNGWSGPPLWGVGLSGGTYNGPCALWHSYSFSPSTALFDTTDKYRCIAVTGDGSTARVYSDGHLIDQGTYTATTPEYFLPVRLGAIGPLYENTNTFNVLSLYWTRALSASELAELAQNPWQIFAVEQPRPVLFQPTPKPPPVEPWFTKRVRTSQPQQPVGIDWGNPITRRLVAAFVPSMSTNLGIPGGTGIAGRLMIPDSVRRDVAPILPAPAGSFQTLIAVIQGIGGSGMLGVGHGASVYFRKQTATTAQLLLSTVDAGAYTTVFPIPNRPFVLVVRTNFGGFGVRVYIDGALVHSQAFPGSCRLANATLHLGGNPFGNGGGSQVYGAALLVRDVSDAEIQSVSLNFWQIFAPINATAWVPV